MAEEQVVVFLLGTEKYALPISKVKEIIQYKQPTPLPRVPIYIEGIIELRGKIIPVLNLAQKFGLNLKAQENQRVILIEAADKDVGIVVDDVDEVLHLDDSLIEPAPNMTNENHFIRGVGKVDGQLIILLDLEELLAATTV